MPKYTVADVPTPALIIDEAVVDRNIDAMARYVKAHKIGLRPHTKTHKSILMARKQKAAGAIGMTAAKVGEALVMAQVDDDLLLAYPALDPARTAKIAELAKTKTIHVAVDSAFAADALAAAARSAGSTIGILVDIDTGFHRTGLQTPEQALALAQHVSRTSGLRLDGIFCYPGHVLGTLAEQPQLLLPTQQTLAATLELWTRHGLAAKIVSGGNTPAAYNAHHVPAYTEVRPGTYIYYDRNCLAGDWCTVEDCAARILATVVSDGVPGKVVVDSGSKTLTNDRLWKNGDTAGYGLVVEYPQAKIVRLSEEHGEVDLAGCDNRPKLGDRVQIIPNHICPCVNLQDSAWLKKSDGSLEPLTVDARGKLS